MRRSPSSPAPPSSCRRGRRCARSTDMMSRIRSHRSGQAIVIMALAMVAICGMLALAIDAGRLYFQRRLMQDAVDAGSLAGAQSLVGTVANPGGVPSDALFYALQDSFSVFNQSPANARG